MSRVKKHKKPASIKEEEQEKKKSSKKKETSKGMILTAIIAFIMLSSVIGFMWKPQMRTFDYGDFSFEQEGNKWFTEVEGTKLGFYFLPTQLENLNVSEEVINSIKNTRMVYLTFNPNITSLQEVDLIRFEAKEEFPQYFNIFVVDAVSVENSSYELPYVTCENATEHIPVIYFNEKNKTNIYMEDNCIHIESDSGVGFLYLKERLIYGLVGIIR